MPTVLRIGPYKFYLYPYDVLTNRRTFTSGGTGMK